MQKADTPSFADPILALFPAGYRATASMCLAALCFSLMSVFIKLSYELGAHQFQTVGFRAFFGWIVLAPWILRVGRAGIETKIPVVHFIRSVVGFAAMVLLFSSFRFLPMSQVVSLNFSAPLFTLVFAVAFFGERVGLRRTMATMVGFAGMLVIVQPWNDSRFAWVMMLPLAAAMLMGIVPHILRRMASSESTDVMVFYQGMWMTLFALPLMFWFWQPVPPLAYVWMIGCGVLGYMGQTFFVEATHRGEASQIMLYDYLRLPLIAAAELAILNVLPDVWILPGAILIIGSAIYIARREAWLQSQRAASEQTTTVVK